MQVRSLAIPVLALAGALLASGTARAVTLRTPFVRPNGDQTMRTVVTNFGTKPITVSVTLINSVGSVDSPAADECTGIPLAAGNTCLVQYTLGHGGFCTVESSGSKVRAAINVLGSGAANFPLVTLVPATK
jgi:hypothetical protein